MKRHLLMGLVLALATMVTTSSVFAQGWCGENGLIRLSFAQGDELQAVKTITEESKGVTIVDLYAYLTDVEAVKINGEALLGVGALDFTLVIEGSEGFFTSQEFPVAHRTVGRRPGEILVGFDPGIILKDDHTLLVHWKILFQGSPENVVFKLDSKPSLSCERTPGCVEAGTYGQYTGTNGSRQTGSLFGAGYVPAYLNFEGEADLEPLRGKVSWRDVGICEER